ncbi:MAG: hypothetical protein A2144_04445 [Chloroflexi bacterium RBG_16_50_9]|nr:MAG: hypothetical protein A2144_04445 [Chloroflexi bacterium RBG_16_50_9]
MWPNVYQTLKSDYSKLLPIMGLAFYIAFMPHQSSPLPVHIDEWFHWALANEVMSKASVSGLNEPFFGGAPVWNQLFELGFSVFFGVFQKISGLPWLLMIRYFPGIIFMITVLSAYVLARRQGFGWQAALFAALVPTTVGVLGPGFLVPVGMGLLFIPLSIFLVFNFKTTGAYVTLAVFVLFLASMHAATAIGIAIIVAPFLLLDLRKDLKHSLLTVLVFTVPLLAAFPWVFALFLEQARAVLNPVQVTWYVDIPRLIKNMGYPLLALFLLGIFVMALRGGKRNFGLILGCLALFAVLSIFFTLHYGIPSIYERGLVYAMLVAGIVAGAGLSAVQDIRLPTALYARQKTPVVIRSVGPILCLAAIGLTLATSIPLRQQTPYYHMITPADYEAFVWIRDNVAGDYDRAILDPWKTTAFTAVTGKKVFARTHTYPTPKDALAYEFLRGGGANTTLMRENGISIVYNEVKSSNPDLVEVRKNVYLLREPEKGR